METKTLETKLKELEQRAKESNTYCTDIRLEIIQEMLDFIECRKPVFDDVPQIDYNELEANLNELSLLKDLAFDTFEEAMEWLEHYADTTMMFDEDDGYIDFGLGRLDCTFNKSKDGKWRLSDITRLYDTDHAILEIVG